MVFKFGYCTGFVNLEVDDDTGERFLNLHNIEATASGQGYGTEVLRLVKEYAQSVGLEVRCHPWAVNGNHARLKAWYSREGFLDMGDWWVYYPK